MSTCNVKEVARSNKPTDNYRPTLQFPSALRSFIASFGSLLWFTLTALIGFVCISNRELFNQEVLVNSQTKLATSW